MKLDERKTTGILTQYYKSHNYGGLLQSYALVQAINSLGYRAEQICLDTGSGKQHNGFASRTAVECLKHIVYSILNKAIEKKINERFRKMEQFGERIPHSATVYTQSTIAESVGNYAAYVVGSDQVWNPKFYTPAYFCDFVGNTGARCISYAASVSQKRLTEQQKTVFTDALKKFSAISLRENDLELIQELTEKKVRWVLDPTLLLSANQWDQICAPRQYEEPYLFCYFLGQDPAERRLAAAYARRMGLKVVTIPHLMGTCEKTDLMFGDIRATAASPEEFLSLIKYSECVFTDSFHACVFSHIFHRNFYVFQRFGCSEMSSRIETLLALVGAMDRFCDKPEKQTMDYLMQCPDIDYSCKSQDVACMRDDSYSFLRENLQGCPWEKL